MTDQIPADAATAFDAWWPRHAGMHNSRSPKAAREAFDAGWEAAALVIAAQAAAAERERLRQFAEREHAVTPVHDPISGGG